MKYKVLFFLSPFLVMNLFAKDIILGVVPQQSPYKLLKVWKPLVNYLQKTTGDKIILKIERSIPEFEKVLYSGGYDVAYMNPYHYVVANKKKGYLATVRADKNIVGILVAHKNSKITALSKLNDEIFLFPAPYAFAATLLIKYELLKEFGLNLDDFKVRYVNSHDSVYKGIARNIGDVGGGIERTLHNLNDEKSKKTLKILYKTKAYPSHPFAIKPTLSKSTQERLVKAMLSVPADILHGLSIRKLRTTSDSEYDIIRELARDLSLLKE